MLMARTFLRMTRLMLAVASPALAQMIALIPGLAAGCCAPAHAASKISLVNNTEKTIKLRPELFKGDKDDPRTSARMTMDVTTRDSDDGILYGEGGLQRQGGS